MDDSSHRENGRHRPDMYRAPQSQWLMQQPQSMKHIMSIMAERDAAIQERNMAVSEKKKALEERDLAIMQRDAAIQERDNAAMERDNAIAALRSRPIPMNNNNSIISSCPPGCQISRGVKHMHNLQQHASHMGEPSCDSRDVQVHDALPLTSPKPRKPKRAKETTQTSPSNKRPSKSTNHKAKKGDDLNRMMFHKSPEWKDIHDMDDSDDYNEQLGDSKSGGWKGSDLGLNHAAFDESSILPPVCSCTGVYRQCYKWGNGGWQSACCTTTLSMYPLPCVPNKRHARVGGRKMSGSAFNKLLSRLAAEGHDLSAPVDLKDHWAKHGTNRYITIR